MDLFTPDFGLIFWMFVSFAVLFLILWKFAWPAIIKTVDSRADLIDKGVEYAQSAKQQLDNASMEAKKYIAEAQRQQAEMLREADKMDHRGRTCGSPERSPKGDGRRKSVHRTVP